MTRIHGPAWLLCPLLIAACSGDGGGTSGGGTAGSGATATGGTVGTVGTAGTASGTSGTATGMSGTATGGTATGTSGTATGGTTGDTGGTGGGGAVTNCDDPGWSDGDFATVYEVGPGKMYATPSEVPWESLQAGTLVKIFARTEPYRDKWVIGATGTEQDPVVVLGVPVDGKLPVISGDGATTRTELDYWNPRRSIVKIGGSNQPNGDDPAYITVQCLDIRDARPEFSFTDDGGAQDTYAENAAAIHIEQGRNISLRNNVLHRAGNGLFTGSGSSEVLVSGNYIYDNGIDGSIYQHNSYTESLGITFEYNRYGPLCDGCLGNNLKDRSAGTVIRYNWIEDGNRQLDLVETDYQEIASDPRYTQTFVYGNVLVEGDGQGNSQIMHYGGDGDNQGLYRAGTLYLYFNTIVSTRGGNTTLVRLSTESESMQATNNIIYVTAGGSRLGITTGRGTATLSSNWLPTGWVETHDTLTGAVNDDGNLEGADPGFVDANAQDFTLAPASPCRDAAGEDPMATASYPADRQYVVHQSGEDRPMNGPRDLGAFEG